jgi:TPR repeat protein
MTTLLLRYRDGQPTAVGDAVLSPELVPCRVVGLPGDNPPVALVEDGVSGGRRAVHDLSTYRLVARDSTDFMRAGVDMLLQRALAGEGDAQYALGSLHTEGAGVEQSYEKAAGWFLKAASQGDATAQS